MHVLIILSSLISSSNNHQGLDLFVTLTDFPTMCTTILKVTLAGDNSD